MFDPSPPPPPRELGALTLSELLQERTPRLWVTRGLIAANALVFAVMVFAGVDPMNPTVPDLLRWGANSGALAGDGEPWRLFSCTFVHAGLVHVAMNLWVLSSIGPFVERLLGNVGFLITYLFAGLAGSLASAISNPYVTSVGASGAVFGVVGALLGVLTRRPLGLPEQGRVLLRRQMLIFVGMNVFIGFAIPRIDMAGHLGGLAAGFVAGLVLGRRTVLIDAHGQKRANLVLALVGCAEIALGTLLLPSSGAPVMRAALEFEVLRERSMEIARSIDERSERGELSPGERRELGQRELIGPWRAFAAEIEDLPDDDGGLARELREDTQRILDSYESALGGARDRRR